MLRVIARCLFVFAILTTLVAVGRAWQTGGSAGGDFAFYFSVNGYDAGGWFGEPSAMALDQRDSLVYVADKKAGVVDAFSLQGVPKFQYGAKAGLKSPVGVAVDRSGNVYVSEDEAGPIKIIDRKGVLTTLEVPKDEHEGKQPPTPGRMFIDRDGTLYVVDRANGQVVVFDRDRKFKFRFGGIGDRRGEFKLLEDVTVDRQGRIYAVDALGVPVQVFDRKGGYIYGFGIHGEGGDGLSFPAGLWIDRHDQVWIPDKARHCVKVFDRSGTLLKSFGTYGQGEGSLFYPIAAAVDTLGRVYVLEFGARRLQVFTLSTPYEPFNPYGLGR